MIVKAYGEGVIYATKSEVWEDVCVNPLVGLDIETPDLYQFNRISVVSLSTQNNQYFIDTRTPELMLFVNSLFAANVETIWIIHSASFDALRILHNGGRLYKVWCTKVCEQKLTLNKYDLEDKPYSLSNTLFRRFGKALNKEEQLSFGTKATYTTKQMLYGLDDVKDLIPLYKVQYKEAQERGMVKSLVLENQACTGLIELSYNGIYLDIDMWIQRQVLLVAQIKQLLESLNNFVRADVRLDKFVSNQIHMFDTVRKVKINWNSGDQVKDCFKTMGLDLSTVDKNTRKTTDSLGKARLSSYRIMYPIVEAFALYKEYSKAVNTFGAAWRAYIRKETNRIHPNIKQLVSTGRTSMGGDKKNKAHPNTNLQNILKDAESRACFRVQSPEFVMYSADYRNQEMYVMEHMSRDASLTACLVEGQDLHNITATAISKAVLGEHVEITSANKGIVKTPKGVLLRDLSKTVNFSGQYLVGAKTLAGSLNVEVSVAQAIIDATMEKYYGRNHFIDDVWRKALRNGYIKMNNVTNSVAYLDNYETYLHYLKKYDGTFRDYVKLPEKGKNLRKIVPYVIWRNRKSVPPNVLKDVAKWFEDWHRLSANVPIQGTSAEITKQAIINVHKWISSNSYYSQAMIVNTIHDELVYEVHRSLESQFDLLLEKAMVDAGRMFLGNRLLMKVSIEKGDCWIH